MKNLVYLFLVLIALTACTTTKYIPVETVTTKFVDRYVKDTVQIERLQRTIDSIQSSVEKTVRDCVIIVIDTTGNVRMRQEWHNTERTRNTERLIQMEEGKLIYKMKYDSLLAVIDSISQVPYPVERRLSRWEKFKSDWFGYLVIVSLAAMAVLYIILWWQKKKNKSNI